MCVVTEERNGAYELEMEYVEGGVHFEDLKVSRIILAKPSQLATPQPFRICKITKPLNKRVQVFAQHISYQLTHIPVKPFTANSAYNALNGMVTNSVGTNPFSVQTTVSTAGTFAPEAPASFRNMLGGMSGSVLDVFGGELEFDMYTVKLLAARGTDRGLTLRYGKNITDINQEESIEATITGVLPYLKDQAGVTLYLDQGTVESPTAANYPYPRNVVLDMASYVDERKIREDNPTATEAQIEVLLKAAMLTAAQSYISANRIGIPDVSIDVEYINLGDTEEYSDISGIFSQAALCDTVEVTFERLGISTTAKIVKTEYNTLLERYERVTIGTIRPTLGGTIAEIQSQTEAIGGDIEAVEDSILNQVIQDIAAAVEAATDAITGQDGGYVKINSDANGRPYELLIMDNPNQTQAVKVWRWNLSGLGYSESGYGGPYTDAWVRITDPTSPYYNRTIFNTDMILAGTLSGAKLIAGTVDTDQLNAGAVTAEKIDAGAITAGMISGQLSDSQIASLSASKLSGQIDTGTIGWIKLTDGTFSLAGGKFFYTNGQYIELSNNLSLRLNGVPINGRIYDGIVAHSDFTDVYKQVIEYPSFVLVHLRFTLPKKTVAADSVLFENFWVNEAGFANTVPIINITGNDFSQSFAYMTRFGYLHSGRYGQIKNTAQIGNSSANRTYEINMIYPVDWSTHIDP
jgi:phage minor structural protein